jgi:hypothetical protein
MVVLWLAALLSLDRVQKDSHSQSKKKMQNIKVIGVRQTVPMDDLKYS